MLNSPKNVDLTDCYHFFTHDFKEAVMKMKATLKMHFSWTAFSTYQVTKNILGYLI